MAPPQTHIIEVEADSADPRVLRFLAGTVMNPLTVGRRGMWRVEAPDVLDIHAYLYFDGRALFVQSAKESWPAIVEGSEMPCRWVAVSAPCRISIGGATLHFRVLVETHIEDHTEEATAVASRHPLADLLPPPAPDEATIAELYRDDDRTQVEARTRSSFGMPASGNPRSHPASGDLRAPPTTPTATPRMDRSPESARTIARAKPSPDSARTIARAKPSPDSARTIARAQPVADSARTSARAAVVAPPAPTTAPQPGPSAKPPKAAPSGRDVSREAGAAAAGASLGSVLADKYRVDRVIGRGGMSYVIEGTHVQLGQKVAIKLLRRALAEAPDAYDRALAEARAAAQITSEHAAKVFDIGSLDDGAPFIVMELLNGVDLRTRLSKSGPVSSEDAVEYVLQACDALAEAHGRGVVHRDLKPANLFLTKRPDGSPMIKVLDFGLAKLEGLADRAALRGSPGYASPEQLQPGRNVDARADVWALGVILFELVSGKLPFDAPKLTEMLAVTTERPPHPLTSPRGPLPPSFERIVLRCLSPDPGRRFASVGELAEALVPMAPARMRPYSKRIWDQLNGVRPAMTFTDTTTKITATSSLSLDASASMLTEDTRGSESLVVAGTEGPVTAPLGAKRDPLIVAEVLPRRSWVSTALVIALAVALPTAAAIWRTSRSKTPPPPPPAASEPVAEPAADPVTQIEVYAPPARDAGAMPIAPMITTVAPSTPTVVAGGGALPAPTPRRPPPPPPPKQAPAPHQNPTPQHPNPLTYR